MWLKPTFFIQEKMRDHNWYNNIHLHSGINFVTLASKHFGIDKEVLNKRHLIYQAAKAKNPNRWSKETRNWSVVDKVELNPKKEGKLSG